MQDAIANTSERKGTQGDTANGITSRITLPKDKVPHPVFKDGKGWNLEGRGERMPKVYWRCGSFYARWKDPAQGRERFVKSPDGTLKGACDFLRMADRNARGRAAFAFSEAVTEKLQPERGAWSIGRCIEEYAKFAPGHFAAMSSERRKRGGGLTHSLWSARTAFAAAIDRTISEAPRALASYAAAELAKGTKRSTVHGVCSQAKSVFAKWALVELEERGCKVPDLRWRGIPSDDYQYAPPPQELRDRTIAAGKEELAKGSPFGLAFLLEFYCAMSAADACRARWDWLGADDVVRYQRAKTGKDAWPRLRPEIAARWRELARERGAGAILPRNTDQERNSFLVREFAGWMRSLGWGDGKKGHELRKMACSLWYSTPGVGAEVTQAWSGDSLEVLQKHYARLLPEKAPMPPSV